MRILYVGINAHNTRGFSHALNARANPQWECPRKIFTFYTWGKMRIIYVGKPTHIMHGQTRSGNAGMNPHNTRGLSHALNAWAKPQWECPCKKVTCYRWENVRIIYVGKTTHIMHGQTHSGNAHVRYSHFIHGEKCA